MTCKFLVVLWSYYSLRPFGCVHSPYVDILMSPYRSYYSPKLYIAKNWYNKRGKLSKFRKTQYKRSII